MKPENKSEVTASQSTVTSGGFRGALSRRRNKKIVIVAIAVIILVLGGLAYTIYRQLNPSVVQPKLDTSSLPANYARMTVTELELALKTRTDLTLDQLKNNTITSGMLKNFDQAYIAARVLSNPNVVLYSKAVTAYGIADNFAGHKAPEAFYTSYADTALRAQDITTWKQQMANAKAAVQRDTKLSADFKQKEITRLDSVIQAQEAGY